MANELRHSIKVVARRTGLSPHLIRAWEKRYSTTQPERNDGNRRLYTFEDIDRLTLLKRATDAGHSIGDVARLRTDQLTLLMAQDSGLPGGEVRKESVASSAVSDVGLHVADAFAAVEAMDSGRLEAVLERASVECGQVRLLNDVIVPLDRA